MTRATLYAVLRLVFLVANAVLGLALTLAVGAVIFVLFSSAGSELALRQAERLSAGVLRVEGVSGRLWGPLHVDRLVLSLGAADVEIRNADLRAELPVLLLRRQLLVDSLRADLVRVQLKPAPEDKPRDGHGAITALPFGLRVREASLGQMRIEAGGGEPILIDTIELAASWIGDRVVVEHLAATTPWVGRARLDGAARLLPDAIELQPLHAQGFAIATLEGRFGYGTASDLHLRWQRIAWPPPGTASGGATQQLDSGGGEAHWRGSLDDYRFDLRGAAQLPQLTVRIDGEGRGSQSGVTLERLHAEALDGRLDAKLRLAWTDGLRLDGEGRVAGIRPELLLPELPGLINGQFKASTTLRDGRPEVRFSVALQDSKLRDYPLKLDASGLLRSAAEGEMQLRLDSLAAQSGRVQLQASGQVLPTLDAQAQLDAADLADAWPGLQGQLRGALSARGPLRQPRVTADLHGARLSYRTLRLATATLVADLDPRGRLDLDLQLRELDAGVDVGSATLGVHGPVGAHRISAGIDSKEGDFTLAAEGALDLARPAWTGRLLEARIAPKKLAAWQLEQPTALTLSATPSVEPTCLRAGEARACLSLKRDKTVSRVDVALSDFALSYLQPLLPSGAQVDVRLHASGFAEFGPAGLQDLHADVATEAGRWQLGGLTPIELRPARLVVDDDGAGTRIDVDLPFASGALQLQARLAPGAVFMERPLEGTLHADVPDLSWLPLINVEIGAASGHINGTLQLSGTLAEPHPRGRLALSDGTLKLVSPGIELREIGVRVDADGAAPLRIDGEASSGEGRVHLAGSVDPRRDPLALDLTLRGENFQAAKTSDVRAWVSPDLRITLAEQNLKVTGSVTVPRAEITPKSLGDGSIAASSDEVLVGNDPGAQQRKDLHISADVTLKLGDKVHLEGFGLKTDLEGSVQAIEQPGLVTRARGEIRLVDGHYKAYGQDLNIETGRLIFTGGAVTEPGLELRATRKPTEDITVGLQVRGTLNRPDFKLFSTPPMPQDQQLGWLILGRPINQTTSATDKAMVGNAATSLGLAGGEWLAGRLGSKIGIDEVSVGAKPGQTNDQAMFTVGKYLSPKLFIAYGVGLFQPGHTFRMQYDIGKGFKVQTETGVQSGGDLLYTIERK